MSPLPPDLIKTRDEMADHYTDNDAPTECDELHVFTAFVVGFNAAAEIFLKREAELKNSTDVYSKKFVQYHDAYLKLQARNDKLVEALEKSKVIFKTYGFMDIADRIDEIIEADKEQL